MTIRVLVVDDHELVRTAVGVYLTSADDLTLVGELASAEAALQILDVESVDVVLMDLQLPGIDGVAATRRIVAEHKATRVLVLSASEADRHVLQAMRAGAAGFLNKGVQHNELLHAIRTVHAGKPLLDTTSTSRLLDGLALEATDSALGTLTKREHEVLELLSEGASNATIAERLVLSETTVKSHVSAILRKLELRDRTQVAVFGARRGLGRGG